MEIKEIADGTITLEIEPDEAMSIARGFSRALEAPFDSDSEDAVYRLYRSLFEAMSVAAHSQYCIEDTYDASEARLTALRRSKRAMRITPKGAGVVLAAIERAVKR